MPVGLGEADLSVSGENFTNPTCHVFNIMERVAISAAHLQFKPFHLSTERPISASIYVEGFICYTWFALRG